MKPLAVTPTTLLLELLVLLILGVVHSAKTSYAVDRWKAPNSSTPPDLVHRWRSEDEALIAYIKSTIPAVLEHTGSSDFDEHLQGVQSILRYWSSPKYLYNAGLFHSIYGTEGFQGFALPLTERDKIRSLIGHESERLCWIFCMVDRSTVDKTVFEWSINSNNNEPDEFTFYARPELGRFQILLTKREWIDFIELSLADWLEQVQGAAERQSNLSLHWKIGEAYTYRRTAYAKMVDILSHERRNRLEGIVKDMYADVYATEGPSTRHLIQYRTPPPTDAAKLALEALRSAGENIPLDFVPQPSDSLSSNTCSQDTLVTVTKESLVKKAVSNAYETDDLLNMYLGLHYPLSGCTQNLVPILDHDRAPNHGLRFPQRVAELLLSLNPIRTTNRALDVGCSVGGSSFQLARSFDHVEAFDFSENFITAAKQIQAGVDNMTLRVIVEGDIIQNVSVVLEPGLDINVRSKVNFWQGNACDLSYYANNRDGFGTFDGVILANLLCRLPDPRACLTALPRIVNEGGVVVIVTPYSWLDEYTPRNKWLGGVHDPVTKVPMFSKDKLKEIMESLGFEKIHEEQMPLVIREHQRKYQYIVSEATGWRKTANEILELPLVGHESSINSRAYGVTTMNDIEQTQRVIQNFETDLENHKSKKQKILQSGDDTSKIDEKIKTTRKMLIISRGQLTRQMDEIGKMMNDSGNNTGDL